MYHVQQRDDASIIEVNGELTFASSRALSSAIALATLTFERPIVVSLAGCSYCDSAGLRILVTTKNRLKERFLVVVPATSRLNRIFDAARLTRELAVYTSIEEALDKPTFVTLSDFTPRGQRPQGSRYDTFGPPPRRRRSATASAKTAPYPLPYADIVPMMRTLAASGVSLRDIAAKLDEDGHTTVHGEHWCAIQVSRVLSRYE